MQSDKYDYTVEGAVPEKDRLPRYYSSTQILIAALLSGPLSGIWLMAKNFKFWGEYDKARTTWVYGSIATIVFIEICFFIPETVPDSVFPPMVAAVLAVFVDKHQKKKLQELADMGTGLRQSNWKVAGYSFMGFVAILTLAILMGITTESIYPELFLEEIPAE